MENKEYSKKIAKLETINDQLLSELQDLDRLTKKVGFTEGIKTLKLAALELLKEMEDENSKDID
ncbi:MAG: hypothetical protein K1060chlam5_00693 [Candidatus Anoxychlamydiales bacterium]|nr:hypothetical protein [Candidatus Anoxychlamydiales bacterium]